MPRSAELRVVPVGVLHCPGYFSTCAGKAHIGLDRSVPKIVLKGRPKSVIHQSNANHGSNEKRAWTRGRRPAVEQRQMALA